MEEIIIENGCNPLMTLSTAAFIASEAEKFGVQLKFLVEEIKASGSNMQGFEDPTGWKFKFPKSESNESNIEHKRVYQSPENSSGIYVDVGLPIVSAKSHQQDFHQSHLHQQQGQEQYCLPEDLRLNKPLFFDSTKDQNQEHLKNWSPDVFDDMLSLTYPSTQNPKEEGQIPPFGTLLQNGPILRGKGPRVSKVQLRKKVKKIRRKSNISLSLGKIKFSPTNNLPKFATQSSEALAKKETAKELTKQLIKITTTAIETVYVDIPENFEKLRKICQGYTENQSKQPNIQNSEKSATEIPKSLEITLVNAKSGLRSQTTKQKRKEMLNDEDDDEGPSCSWGKVSKSQSEQFTEDNEAINAAIFMSIFTASKEHSRDQMRKFSTLKKRTFENQELALRDTGPKTRSNPATYGMFHLAQAVLENDEKMSKKRNHRLQPSAVPSNKVRGETNFNCYRNFKMKLGKRGGLNQDEDIVEETTDSGEEEPNFSDAAEIGIDNDQELKADYTMKNELKEDKENEIGFSLGNSVDHDEDDLVEEVCETDGSDKNLSGQYSKTKRAIQDASEKLGSQMIF